MAEQGLQVEQGGVARRTAGIRVRSWPIRTLVGVMGATIIVLAVLYLFHFVVMLEQLYLSVLMALSIPILFLLKRASAKTSEVIPWYDIALALIGVGIGGYFALNAEKIAMAGWDMTAPTPAWLAGFVLLLLLMEGIRRAFGWWIFGIAMFFLFEPLFSHLLPMPLQGLNFPLPRVMSYHAFGRESVLGPVGAAGGKLLIGYLLFAATLQAGGGGKLMLELALSVFGRFRGGPAKVSTVAGAAFGMFSPSSIATVLTNGPYTIPAMKKAGYPAEYAAAVETCSGAGGAFMPPIMGASAFIMASLLDMSYWTIVIAAVTPSFLYYYILFVQADGFAARNGLKGMARGEYPSFWRTMRKSWPFLFPILVLVWFLANQEETAAPFYATAALLVASFVLKEGRPNLKSMLNSFESSFEMIAELFVLLYALGVLIGSLTLTGVAITLGFSLADMVGKATYLLPLVAMVAGYILGTGLPVIAVYIVLAVSLAPALVSVGYPLLPVHIFCVFIGELSMLTPPVATPAIVACQIAGIPKSIMRVGWIACRLGLGLFVLPMIWLYNPAVMLGQGPFWDVVVSVGAAVVGFGMVAGSFERYFIRWSFTTWQAVFLGVAGIAIALVPIWIF